MLSKSGKFYFEPVDAKARKIRKDFTHTTCNCSGNKKYAFPIINNKARVE